MDAQEEHDYLMSKRRIKSLEGAKRELEALLEAKRAGSPTKSAKDCLDPIEAVIKNNPGLTRQEVAEMAEKFGF
jgi:hypothetical protein